MSRQCIEDGCERPPIYNYPDKKSRVYCSIHAKEGMRIIGPQYCREPGCNEYALYNYQYICYGETLRLYCQTHFKAGMIRYPPQTVQLWWYGLDKCGF